jgi:hypothetical protein
MNRVERRELLLPVFALVVATVTACGAVYYTDTLLKQGRLQLSQQEAQSREARIRLHRSGDERDLIIRYLSTYQELQRIGFAGDEQRINWLDGLRLANERSDLFGIDYQIAAQTTYAHAGELNPGDLVLHQSVMTMRFRLLHEEDLLRFFNTLRDAGAGMFAIDECAISRASTGDVLRYQPNLVAECKLSWITAKPRRSENDNVPSK